MPQLAKAFTTTELAKYLGVTPQTIRNKLALTALTPDTQMANGRLLLTSAQAADFIAECYPNVYTKFMIDCNLPFDAGGDDLMKRFPIPDTVGKIAKVTVKGGKVYFYIRGFPLCYAPDGTEVLYSGEGYSSREAAEKARKKLISQRKRGVFRNKASIAGMKVQPAAARSTKAEPAKQTYYDFCYAFEANREMAEKTRSDYLNIIKKHFRPVFGQVPISSLSKGMLQRFLDSMGSNVQKTKVILKMTCERLYALDLIPENYYLKLILPHKQHRPKQKRPLTQDQVKRFLAYFKGSRVEHAMYLIFYTGLREGELLALQWKDIELIDEATGLVHVNHSWGLTPSGKYGLKAPKTPESVRIVPFHSRYLVSLLKHAKAAGKSQWVVENKIGTAPIELKNFTNRCFKEVSQKLGFAEPITSHYARHTFISNLANKNIPLPEIAKLAGHTTTEMVMRVYAHPFDEITTDITAVLHLYE